MQENYGSGGAKDDEDLTTQRRGGWEEGLGRVVKGGRDIRGSPVTGGERRGTD